MLLEQMNKYSDKTGANFVEKMLTVLHRDQVCMLDASLRVRLTKMSPCGLEMGSVLYSILCWGRSSQWNCSKNALAHSWRKEWIENINIPH